MWIETNAKLYIFLLLLPFIQFNSWMWIETWFQQNTVQNLYLSSSLTAGCGLKRLCVDVQRSGDIFHSAVKLDVD
jgi:hypothetical protein